MKWRFLVLQDHREKRRKCTAYPLRNLPGVELVRLSTPRPAEERLELPRGIWLDVDAPTLSFSDRESLRGDGRIVVFDATWARVPALRVRVRNAPGFPPVARSLPADLRTAYPRRSKLYQDPTRGLATVEAIFSTTVVLGEPWFEVLSGYRWAREFLESNEGALRRYGCVPPPFTGARAGAADEPPPAAGGGSGESRVVAERPSFD